MIFYMLRDNTTGAWYKRGHGRSLLTNWVDQKEASVWTTTAGPTACLGAISRSNARMSRLKCPVVRKPEIIPFHVSQPIAVAFVHCDDWEGLYIDGKLVREGHNVEVDDLPAETLGISIECIYPNDDWLPDGGRLPKDLSEVPR